MTNEEQIKRQQIEALQISITTFADMLREKISPEEYIAFLSKVVPPDQYIESKLHLGRETKRAEKAEDELAEVQVESEIAYKVLARIVEWMHEPAPLPPRPQLAPPSYDEGMRDAKKQIGAIMEPIGIHGDPLAQIHRAVCRGDGHETPEMTARCIISAFTSRGVDHAEEIRDLMEKFVTRDQLDSILDKFVTREALIEIVDISRKSG